MGVARGATQVQQLAIALGPLLAGAALVIGVGIWLPGHRPSPFWGRAADIADTVLIVGLFPLALGRRRGLRLRPRAGLRRLTVMQSRRDLFQAHRLMTQRASLALLRGEPDIPDQPLRRLNVATFSGVLVAVIVYRAVRHLGPARARRLGAAASSRALLVIDKQTGNAYVFCQRGKLCPVLNYASARLALQSPSVTQQTVSQAALTKFARGPLIGIPGLPQPLPEAGLLVRQPWSVCTQSAVGLSGQQTRTALAGGISTGGQPLAGRALLTRALGQDWVIWHGQRDADPAGHCSRRCPASRTPVTVPAVWLDALPQGPAFAPPAIPDQGATGDRPGRCPVQVGQVYDVSLVAGSPLAVLRDAQRPAWPGSPRRRRSCWTSSRTRHRRPR